MSHDPAPFWAHPSAIVDECAQIGAGTRVWHFAHVCAGARIGEGCSLGQGVFVGNDVVIGRNVKIQNQVSVYDAVTLEDDVFCGPSMVFTNVHNPRAAVVRKADASEPTWGSVKQKAPSISPCARSVSHFFCCASLP
jgi:UDP-2-acetamido-3-amino-2,3-dideoxy-glucuronate N-acetyltransferase